MKQKRPALHVAILWVALASTAPLASVGPQIPNAAVDPPQRGEQTAVLAGGCFWGVEAVFEALNGVKDVVSGYAGGKKETANYRAVCTGRPLELGATVRVRLVTADVHDRRVEFTASQT